VPICLDTKDPEEIVRTVKYIAPVFGGINLEDISAPRCFQIEERLRAELDIPVFHDDQHGTAVVVMAGLINALKIVGKKFENLKIVCSGVGAAGTAVTKMLLRAGVRNIIGYGRSGALYRGGPGYVDPYRKWYAENTNPEGFRGTLVEALEGADVFIGLSGPGLLPAAAIAKMAKDPIVFAMANPVPEVMPEEAAPYARIIATGRSDYPNQINNVLCFPGLFRGVLDSGAREINEEMKLAAAQAIAGVVPERHLHEDYIIPSVFDKKVVRNVAKAVARAALRTGVARRDHKAAHLG
jgi:malate dehydrogenase (oxaloacetate-decarboxylating)